MQELVCSPSAWPNQASIMWWARSGVALPCKVTSVIPNAMERSHSQAMVGAFFCRLSSMLSSFKPRRRQSGRRIWKIDRLKLKPGIWNTFGRPQDNTSKLFSPTWYSIIFCLVKVLLGKWSHSWGLLVLGTVMLGRKLLLLTELTQPARSELLTCLFCLLKNLAVNLYWELVLPHWATECKYIWVLLILLWLYWNDLPYFKIIKAEAT